MAIDSKALGDTLLTVFGGAAAAVIIVVVFERLGRWLQNLADRE